MGWVGGCVGGWGGVGIVPSLNFVEKPSFALFRVSLPSYFFDIDIHRHILPYCTYRDMYGGGRVNDIDIHYIYT